MMNNNAPTKILLVEDEALIAMSEASIIEKYGFSVMMAYSGAQAIEMVRTNPDLDLILMDIDLGQGLDGTQTAAQILEFQELPIVFLTGHAEKEMVDKVKKITRYGYVLKNSGEFVLIESINMAFELFEAHQRAEAENQKLQASERKFRTMYQFSRAGISRLGLDSRIEQANPAYCRMLDYTEPELIGKSISDITHPDDLPENLEKQGQLGRGEIDNFTLEKRFIHKDGHPVYGLLNASVVRDHEDNPEYFLGNVVNITDRKQAEEALLQSESFHRTLLSNISDSIFIADEQGTLTYICPNVEHNFGYSYQEVEQIGNINQLLGKHIFDAAELKEKGELINIEQTVAIRGGRHHTFLINVKPILSGTLYICRDITDRKKADKLLKIREKFNEAILNSVTAHIVVLDKDGVIIAVNEAWRKFAADNGLSPDVGLGENYLEICDQAKGPSSEGAAETARRLRAILAGEKSGFSIEYPCHSPTEQRWFWLRAVPLQSDEGGLVVSHINITDHKKTVRELHRYKHIVRASPDGLSLVDRDYYYRVVSDEYLRRTNKQRHEIEGHPVAEVMGQAVFDNIVKPELDHCFTGEIVRYQEWFDFPNNERRFLDVIYTPYRGDEQTITGALVSSSDITELAEMQEQADQQQRALRALVDAAFDSILLIKPDGEIIECNQTVADRFGQEQHSLLGTNTFSLMDPKIAEYRQARANQVIETGQPVQFEDVRHGRDIRHAINPVINDRDEVEALAVFSSDITEQKHAEQALRDRKERLKQIIQQMPYPVEICTPDGTADIVNQAFLDMFSIPNAEAVIGQYNVFNDNIVMDQLGLRREVERVYRGEMVSVPELIVPMQDYDDAYGTAAKDNYLVQEVTMFPVFDQSGDIWRVVTIWRNITEQKQAESRIQTLLNEKELLLREIHHRIKNDMAAISSILQLHAAASDNPDTTQALTEARRRLNILSNIYEKLYADEDFKKIPLQPLLNDLIADIIRTHAAAGLTVEANIEALPVTAKQSFHLGIIINELVTNACKYAFPDNNWGKIAISVRRVDENHLEITVSDDGVGFSFQSGKAKREGFGCTLIQAMVAQYNGSVKIAPEDGTTVTILMKYMT